MSLIPDKLFFIAKRPIGKTDADVPLIVLGEKSAREEFMRGMTDVTHVAPGVWRMVEI